VKTLVALTGLAVIVMATPAFAGPAEPAAWAPAKPGPGPELAIGVSGVLAAVGAFAATRIKRRR